MRQGDTITPFRAPASTGQTLAWDSFAGKLPVILLFLPSVSEPADVDHIKEFDRIQADFGRERSQLLGVCKATASELRQAAADHSFTIPILADAAGKIIADFGMSEPDGSARRATVIVDRNGTVAKMFDRAEPSGHAAAVLETVRELKRSDQYEMTTG